MNEFFSWVRSGNGYRGVAPSSGSCCHIDRSPTNTRRQGIWMERRIGPDCTHRLQVDWLSLDLAATKPSPQRFGYGDRFHG
jgi:hypothetical protein